MKKRLLVITTDYYPYPSSNTNCFEPLLKGLELDGWKIDIVTRRMRVDSPASEKQENERNIWRIDDNRCINAIRLNEKLNSIGSPLFKKLYRVYATISKVYRYLLYCFGSKEPHFSGWDKKAVISKCLELLTDNNYAAVLSVSHPVITHEIVMELLDRYNENIRWFVYDYDPFCYNESQYGKGCYKKYAAEQHAIYAKCDGIFLGPELYDYYLDTPFVAYKEKMNIFPFANMNEIFFKKGLNAAEAAFDKSKCNCIYAGAIAEDIRNPLYTIKVLGNRVNEFLRFYLITGSKLDFLKSEIDVDFSNLVLLHQQPRNIAYDYMHHANILVDIGNTVTFQVPGKIFEYMAIGKPIIHFSKIDNDPCLRYLEKYPYKLIIRECENNIDEQAKLVAEFCTENKDNNLSFKDLTEIMPEYIGANVVNRFVDTFNSLNRGDIYEKN